MKQQTSAIAAILIFTSVVSGDEVIGSERALSRHLTDGEETRIALRDLLEHGKALFTANLTSEDGAGRPLTKGNGRSLADPGQPLRGARAFNRMSGPDANSCAGCHNLPYGIPGGGGDFATNVFVLGQRFDFFNLDPADKVPTRGSRDDSSENLSLDTFANLRASTGMFGAGYIEMLARQITADLQRIRDSMTPGSQKALYSRGISFGTLVRGKDGRWDTSGVAGLSRLSLLSATSVDPPSLIIRPWHQAGNVISLREFTNNAYNQHHGMQSTERFGLDTDPDGDGVMNELTRADMTAVTLYQATLPVPGRVIPNRPAVEEAIWRGENLFEQIGCARCHIPALPLMNEGWHFEEPGQFNPPANLRRGDTASVSIDLNDPALPSPRLAVTGGREPLVWVRAYTDFKLHDITSSPGDPNGEPLDMNVGTWSVHFAKGNRKFLTKRLWGAANEPPYFHHGRFTTLREAVLAHAGEALKETAAFRDLSEADRNAVIEFLKSLQVLPPGTRALVVDQNFRPRQWPPATATPPDHASAARPQ